MPDLFCSYDALCFRIVGLPVVEGISVHDQDSHILLLVATIASIHCFKLPHPDSITTQVLAPLSFSSLNFSCL